MNSNKWCEEDSWCEEIQQERWEQFYVQVSDQMNLQSK